MSRKKRPDLGHDLPDLLHQDRSLLFLPRLAQPATTTSSPSASPTATSTSAACDASISARRHDSLYCERMGGAW